MSRYTTHSKEFEYVEGIQYKVTEPIIWKIGSKDGPEFKVPTGFIFDVSIPKFLRFLISPHNHKYLKAAAMHDLMLNCGWDRITAGACFHQALKADGVSAITRIAMWLAVSLWKYE